MKPIDLFTLETAAVGDHGEVVPVLHRVKYDGKHDTVEYLHRTAKGASERILAIANHNYERWEDWDEDGKLKAAIDRKDEEAVTELWSDVTGDLEFLATDAVLLDD